MTFRLNIQNSEVSGKAFDSDNDILHEFTEEGTAILKLINGKDTLEEIIKKLSANYNASDDEIREDVLSFIKQSQELKIIEEKLK